MVRLHALNGGNDIFVFLPDGYFALFVNPFHIPIIYQSYRFNSPPVSHSYTFEAFFLLVFSQIDREP